MTDKSKPQVQDQPKAEQQSGEAPNQDVPGQENQDLGEGYTDTNAGEDAAEGTVANESPDPEEAK